MKVVLVNAVYLILMLPSLMAISLPEFKLQPFECQQHECDRIVSITQDENSGKIYVTTTSTVKELIEDLSDEIHERKTIHLSGTQNVLTILRGSELLICKNDLNGTCELRDVDTLDVISPELTQTGIVYHGGGPILAWIYDGPGGENLLTTAISNVDGVDGMVPLPLIATRTFPVGRNSSDGFLELLKNDFLVPSSYFQSMPCLVDAIEPFNAFDYGNYNYILKKHTNENEGTQIKLIRLCKGSIWSYIELPIECQNADIDVAEINRRFLSSAAYFTNEILYISITDTDRDLEIPETRVCNYSISTINEKFTQRRRECLEGKTVSTELTWHQHNYCPQKPPPQFNFSLLNEPDYCYNEPYAQPLGGTKPIVQNAMAQLTIQAVVSAILVVIPTDDSEAIDYLLGDKEGNVHKISNDRRETEVVDVGQGILDHNGLLLHHNGQHIYASSNRKIVKLTLRDSWTTEQPTTTRRHTTNDDSEEDNMSQFVGYIIVGCVSLVGILIVIIGVCIYYVRKEVRGEKSMWK